LFLDLCPQLCEFHGALLRIGAQLRELQLPRFEFRLQTSSGLMLRLALATFGRKLIVERPHLLVKRQAVVGLHGSQFVGGAALHFGEFVAQTTHFRLSEFCRLTVLIGCLLLKTRRLELLIELRLQSERGLCVLRRLTCIARRVRLAAGRRSLRGVL
jgi:hypothetical protein